MNDRDKLRVLIPHWIEHNAAHAAEFRRWAENAGAAAPHILTAAKAITEANRALDTALAALGGPANPPDSQPHPH